ncbi:MAG: hypothetical protein M1822_000530 [Bathelium mastoideum]|nr:MAG: hypothetical protein M1822_000530 [Bathelium mastoideum]
MSTSRKDATAPSEQSTQDAGNYYERPMLSSVASIPAIDASMRSREQSTQDAGNFFEKPMLPSVSSIPAIDTSLRAIQMVADGYPLAPHVERVHKEDSVSRTEKSGSSDRDLALVRSSLPGFIREAFLTPHEEEHLLSAFAAKVYKDIGSRMNINKTRDRIIACMPALLRAFALRLDKSIHSKAQRDARDIIQRERQEIATRFCEYRPSSELNPISPQPPAPHAKRMTLWGDSEHFDTQLVSDKQVNDFVSRQKRENIPKFLSGGEEYQWLLENVESSVSLTEKRGTTLDAISHKIDDMLSSMRDPSSLHFQMFRAEIWMHWDLRGFLEDQEFDATLESAVERAITITGSDRDAQALTCMDYMCQAWPSSGRAVVRALQSALLSSEVPHSK